MGRALQELRRVEQHRRGSHHPARADGEDDGRRVEFVGVAGAASTPPRCPTGIEELDGVLGGGLVQASAVLVGGDPGIGKSTLMLQQRPAWRARTPRLRLQQGIHRTTAPARSAASACMTRAGTRAAINLRDIAASLEAAGDAALRNELIKTMWLDTIDSAPGTVAQVRASSFELIQVLAKGRKNSRSCWSAT